MYNLSPNSSKLFCNAFRSRSRSCLLVQIGNNLSDCLPLSFDTTTMTALCIMWLWPMALADTPISQSVRPTCRSYSWATSPAMIADTPLKALSFT